MTEQIDFSQIAAPSIDIPDLCHDVNHHMFVCQLLPLVRIAYHIIIINIFVLL